MLYFVMQLHFWLYTPRPTLWAVIMGVFDTLNSDWDSFK